MPYDKDLPPVGATPVASRAYLERELQKISLEFGRVNELVDALISALRSGGIMTLFLWNDSLVVGDPGSGNVAGNEILLPNVTIFSVSSETLTAQFPPFGALDAGDLVIVVNETADVQEIYSLDNQPVFNTTWWQFDVTHVSGQNNNPVDGNIMSFIWFPVAEIAEATHNPPSPLPEPGLLNP